jgi:soluble lytic murein transglycosylase
MPRRQLLLIGLIVSTGVWLALSLANLRDQQELQAARVNPYRFEAALEPYARFFEARLHGDTEALEALAEEARSSFLEYRIRMLFAEDEGLETKRRLGAYRRAAELTVQDPLARAEERLFWLDYARVAEAAGSIEEAVAAYARALPLRAAVSGVERLETEPIRRGELFLGARLYDKALETLNGVPAPHVEAPALRALGRHDEALAAYRRWLRLESASEEARYGEAMMLFDLGRNVEAEALFARLPGAQALSYRGHIARRAGKIDEAIGFFRRAGDARNLWLITGELEAEGRHREATALYLELAGLASPYTDHAAYRAYVLATRSGDTRSAERAKALMPELSYFALKLGKEISLPQESTLPRSDHPVLALASALARAGDFDAAVGELRFAARDVEDEASAISIAEALFTLGDHLQSYRLAERWLARGSRDLRTWRLAYPKAYGDAVEAQAGAWNVSPHLVWAVMRQESRYYPRAVSVSNAQGLMQVIPSTWSYIAELKEEAAGDAFDPGDNIRYGTYYLKYLLDRFGGDVELAVAAYNGGPGYVSRLYAAAPVSQNGEDFVRFIDRDETRDYLQQVMLNYHIYNALYPPALADGP